MTYEARSREQMTVLRGKETVRILALETSCDETAAAVVENGRKILSNVVFSQIDLHALYGGVVPEIASRAHMEACARVTEEALREAGETLDSIDALAVTQGPGLVGALLTGVNYMKGLAFAAGKPLIPVHHIEGHISANFLAAPELVPPFLCLVVSGGHSHLAEVTGYGEYRLLGRTVDDAAGEAFDKAARVLGLPYPGGPRMDVLAEEGNPEAFELPKPKAPGPYDTSFSGLKTAFLNLVNRLTLRGEELPKADLAASFRAAVCRELTEKAERLIRDRVRDVATAADRGDSSSVLADRKNHPPVCGSRAPIQAPVLRMAMAGGVSANRELRRRMAALCAREGVAFFVPPPALCTDNGAMIGAAAYFSLLRREAAPLSMNAEPSLPLF